jgi:hypothetical protein
MGRYSLVYFIFFANLQSNQLRYRIGASPRKDFSKTIADLDLYFFGYIKNDIDGPVNAKDRGGFIR